MSSNAFSRPVNIGLLACGERIRVVLKSVLKQAPEGAIRVKGAYDPDPASIDDYRREIGGDFETYASEKALAADPELDWVFIGSWNSQHARHAILALEAGKHVFCEKPLATSLEDCIAIRDAVRASGKTFSFGLVLRYSPHYQKIAELVRSGAIGRIISFEFNETIRFNHGGYIFGNWRRDRRNSGSHLLEKCCHDLDLANWIVGSLPVRVASFGGTDFFTPANEGNVQRIGPDEAGDAAYSKWRDRHRINPFDGNANIFDNQVAVLEYANGVRATFHTNCNAGIPERRFYICGTEGTLRSDLMTGSLEIGRIDWKSEIEDGRTGITDGHGAGDQIMGAALIESMLHGAPPLASIEEAIESSIVTFAIDRAADEGCIVDLRADWQRAQIDPNRVLEGHMAAAV